MTSLMWLMVVAAVLLCSSVGCCAGARSGAAAYYKLSSGELLTRGYWALANLMDARHKLEQQQSDGHEHEQTSFERQIVMNAAQDVQRGLDKLENDDDDDADDDDDDETRLRLHVLADYIAMWNAYFDDDWSNAAERLRDVRAGIERASTTAAPEPNKAKLAELVQPLAQRLESHLASGQPGPKQRPSDPQVLAKAYYTAGASDRFDRVTQSLQNKDEL